MHSVKLVIEGAYWDSQIYSGELLLFDGEGVVYRINWRQVIDRIAELNEPIQTALRTAFSDSDLFYNSKVKKILRDPLIENPIKNQLEQLADINLTNTLKDWESHWIKEDLPFNFLPVDTDIYYDHLFAAGDHGLFSAPRSSIGNKFSESIVKHHDARIFQVRASDNYTALAAAAGDDGLFEFPFQRNKKEKFIKGIQIASRSCSACDWAFQSVMGWTTNNAFLASFKEEKDNQTKKLFRKFDRLVGSDEIFNKSSDKFNINQKYKEKDEFIWGGREKIYRLSEHGLEVVDYRHSLNIKNGKDKKSNLFYVRGNKEINFDTSSVIATGTAPFGAILEFDDCIVVLRSDDEVETFSGEPVHWRIFPRSEHYSNQLHIIYENHIEIISFVHDYFVDQKAKLAGFARGCNYQ